MEASKLFVPGTAVTWQERAVTWQERAVAVEAQKNAVIEELQRQLQAARIANGVVRDDRERLVKEVAELNLRLIERQESHLVQVVRIEETWRGRLRAAHVQSSHMAAELKLVRGFVTGPHECLKERNLTSEQVQTCITHALKSAPPVVPVEDVQPLLTVLREVAELDTGEQPCIASDAKKVLNKFTSQHPQP